MQVYSFCMSIPESLQQILTIFEQNGFEAYIVGGCVRDSLLGLNPKDWDITTNALPNQIQDLFGISPYNKEFYTIALAPEYGTIGVVVKCNKEMFEVTTYRIESGYSDLRHPNNIIFATSLESDLSRRDFSINAFACKIMQNSDARLTLPSLSHSHYARELNIINQLTNIQESFLAFLMQNHMQKTNKQNNILQNHTICFMELFDYYNGLQDLEQKRIVCIGSAKNRFSEDALRIMRALRFCASLPFSFVLDDETQKAVFSLSSHLQFISKERLAMEFQALLLGEYAPSIIKQYKKILQVFLQEFDFLTQEQFECNCAALFYAPKILSLRLAVLFAFFPHGFLLDNKEQYLECCKNALVVLRLDGKTISYTMKILYLADEVICDKISLKIFLSKYEKEVLLLLLFFHFSFARVLQGQGDLVPNIMHDINHLMMLFNYCDEIFINNECYNLKQFPINGNDILKLAGDMGKNITGKEIGCLLHSLLHRVICEEVLCEKEMLLNEIRVFLTTRDVK